jgi:hypothetical protein
MPEPTNLCEINHGLFVGTIWYFPAATGNPRKRLSQENQSTDMTQVRQFFTTQSTCNSILTICGPVFEIHLSQ